MRLLLATLVPLLLVGACGDDGADPSPQPGRDRSVSDASQQVPCSLLEADTLDQVDEAVREAGHESTTGALRVGLMKGEENLLACMVIPDFLTVAIQGIDTGKPLEAYLDYEPTSVHPVMGVGDEAFGGDNSYDGLRVVARQGAHVVLVDSNFYTSPGEAPDVSEQLLSQLADDVLAGLGDEELQAVDLPDICPGADDSRITDETGEVALARGTVTANGSVTCEYASNGRFLRLGSVAADPASVQMYQGDNTTDPVDVDGDLAYFDEDDEVNLIVGGDCVISAASSPMGDALADRRPDDEMHSVVLDLATYVRDELGCPTG